MLAQREYAGLEFRTGILGVHGMEEPFGRLHNVLLHQMLGNRGGVLAGVHGELDFLAFLRIVIIKRFCG